MLLAFFGPLYFFSFSAHLKAAIDKFFSFYCGGKALKIKESALLVCGADPNESSFAGVVASYGLIAGHWGWKDSGAIIVPGVHGKEDISGIGALERAETTGKNII